MGRLFTVDIENLPKEYTDDHILVALRQLSKYTDNFVVRRLLGGDIVNVVSQMKVKSVVEQPSN